MYQEENIVRINAIWTIAHLMDFTDLCQKVYYCWDATTGGEEPPGFCMERINSAGSVSMIDDGTLVTCGDGELGSETEGAVAAVDIYPCAYDFIFHTPSSDTIGIWPRITVASDLSIVMTGTRWEQQDIMWSRNFHGWNQFRNIAPDWIDDDMEPPTIHSGTGGKVGVVIPDYAGAIRLFESTDNGATFDVIEIAPADTADLPSGLDSTIARLGWINTDIMYLGEEPHIVWTAGQGVKINGDYAIIDFKSTIFHWSPSTGIDTVVVAETQSADPLRDDYVPAPTNHLSVDWPSIGLAWDLQTLVVAYTALNPLDVDSMAILPTGYLDIWLATSMDNGDTWTIIRNATNPDGTVLGWDDRYPSVSKINFYNPSFPGADIYMNYQTDESAGTYVMGSEPYENMDYLKFLGVDIEGGGIEDGTGSEADSPKNIQLSQNYPNPFNPSTTIRYHLNEETYVKIQVFDIRGRVVRILVDGMIEEGYHEAVWDGRNVQGEIVASGVYFYKMENGTGICAVRKMVLLE